MGVKEREFTQEEIDAAREFVRLRDRADHPKGYFDSAGRWYPEDRLSCCNYIREPSRKWPYSLLVHCRTAKHVAYERGVDEKVIKKIAKEM